MLHLCKTDTAQDSDVTGCLKPPFQECITVCSQDTYTTTPNWTHNESYIYRMLGTGHEVDYGNSFWRNLVMLPTLYCNRGLPFVFGCWFALAAADGTPAWARHKHMHNHIPKTTPLQRRQDKATVSQQTPILHTKHIKLVKCLSIRQDDFGVYVWLFQAYCLTISSNNKL